jgi:macrolide-specific efflux system membrane fusion protein
MKSVPLLFCIALSLLSAGCYLFPREEKILAPPLIRAPEIEYDTVAVRRDTVEKRILGSGVLVSVEQSDQFFRQSGGRIKSIAVQLGDQVREGDLLAELETEELDFEIEKERLALQKQQLVYEKLKRDSADRTAIETAAIDLEATQLTLSDNQNALEQAELLFGIEKTTERETRVNELRNAVSQANLAVRKAKLRHTKLEREFGDSTSIQSASLDLSVARLRLRDLERKRDQARLTATSSGTVVYIDFQLAEGDVVDAYRTVVRIADPFSLQLEYTGHNISEFQLGMAVQVRIEGDMYTGEVVMTPRNMPVDADETLRNVIRIKVADLPENVRMGEQASISLTLAKRENVLVLPRAVVRSYLGRRYVQVLNGGIREERDVQLGLESATEVEIADGLEEGELVIVR